MICFGGSLGIRCIGGFANAGRGRAGKCRGKGGGQRGRGAVRPPERGVRGAAASRLQEKEGIRVYVSIYSHIYIYVLDVLVGLQIPILRDCMETERWLLFNPSCIARQQMCFLKIYIATYNYI